MSCRYLVYCLVVATLAPVAFVSATAKTSSDTQETDILDYINPLIGTARGGHVFPGATLPFGMAKAVADGLNRDEAQGGFATDENVRDIIGFSHMHDSGTGGNPSLGNFPLLPQVGCPNNDINKCNFSRVDRASRWVSGSVKASPGYFSLKMENLITAEMTVTEHTALYRFTLPDISNGIRSSGRDPVVVVELEDLQLSRLEAAVEVDQSSGRMSGLGIFRPSFGNGTYKLHFCADFSGLKVRDVGTWMYGHPNVSEHSLSLTRDKTNNTFAPAGAWVRFQGNNSASEILSRVGLSFINKQQACNNAVREVPDFNFGKVLSAAQTAWREKLKVVQVNTTSISADIQKVFWSGIYRSMISPQDYTGENPLWPTSEPTFDSYYCIWDTFRSTHPLLTILDPMTQSRLVRSLLDIYRHEGKLPDCRMSLCKGWTQGGSNADVVIVDSFLKNVTGDVDWALAYQAILSDAEVEPIDWRYEGRGGIKSWNSLGYIPVGDNSSRGGVQTMSVSRSVEYAYNDFCISEMALQLNKKDDYKKYLGRSRNWQNLFKADQKSSIRRTNTGFVGFLQPKYRNGTWGIQDPIRCSPLGGSSSCFLGSYDSETYEGSIWLYTFYVPQDMASLVKALGGPAKFVQRLQYFHTSGLIDIGNEQAYLPVFQFHYGGRPGLSAYFSHSYIPSRFNISNAGIPGNDDSGAMGSFSTLAMIGLWPVAGQDIYLITPSFFPEVRVTNGQTNKTATIRNIGFDPSYKAIYIQEATLDGKPYTKSWINHAFWLEGGVLELRLGLKESSWGTADIDLPPSASATT